MHAIFFGEKRSTDEIDTRTTCVTHVGGDEVYLVIVSSESIIERSA
jgi:hypothetical protein